MPLAAYTYLCPNRWQFLNDCLSVEIMMRIGSKKQQISATKCNYLFLVFKASDALKLDRLSQRCPFHSSTLYGIKDNLKSHPWCFLRFFVSVNSHNIFMALSLNLYPRLAHRLKICSHLVFPVILKAFVLSHSMYIRAKKINLGFLAD